MLVLNRDYFLDWGAGSVTENIESPYRKYNLIIKVLRKLFSEKRFIQGVINNPLLKNVKEEKLIVFDASITEEFLSWLQKNNPKTRIIFWYWNPVKLTLSPKKVPKGIEIWSYSVKDCKTYGLKYNTPFYFEPIFQKDAMPFHSDIFFVGRDKGRLNDLMCYKDKFERAGLISDFRIIGNRNNKNCFSHYIPYYKVVEEVQKTKCLFDFYTDPEAGLSLRAMEGLFFEKKIITNNIFYFSQDFYDRQNIFILGKDDESRLFEFVNSEYRKLEFKLKEKYLFKNWITRF